MQVFHTGDQTKYLYQTLLKVNNKSVQHSIVQHRST